jgi:hypothetical protein
MQTRPHLIVVTREATTHHLGFLVRIAQHRPQCGHGAQYCRSMSQATLYRKTPLQSALRRCKQHCSTPRMLLYHLGTACPSCLERTMIHYSWRGLHLPACSSFLAAMAGVIDRTSSLAVKIWQMAFVCWRWRWLSCQGRCLLQNCQERIKLSCKPSSFERRGRKARVRRGKLEACA